jgi:ribosomal protein S18 acetylase RimI-like enzyme
MIKHVNIQDSFLAEKILKLQHEAYLIEAELIKYYDILPLKENLAQLMSSSESFLVFENEHEILGMLSYAIENNNLTICRLTTNPSHFRQGIAGKLMGYLDDLENIKYLNVSTGLLNFPAIKFYEKMGFRQINQTKIDENLVLVHLNKVKY